MRRPSSSWSWRASFAFDASSSVSNVTNPNPLDFPESRSVMTFAAGYFGRTKPSVTLPYFANASRRLLSVVLYESEPM